MCGILGFTGQPSEGQWGETHRLLEALFLASEHRGQHATGFVARAEPYKARHPSRTVMDKRPVPASQFVGRSHAWRALRTRRCSTVVGHVRWATHGSPRDNRNNHPFVGRHGLYLVHNGVLLNHEGTCERKGLALTTECDSEAILRIVEAARHPYIGLDDALRHLRGSMAVAVYDAKHNTTYLARNDGRPLWLLRTRNDCRWFFASTREILLEAFTRVLGSHARDHIEYLFPLAAGHVHVLGIDGTLRGLPDLSGRVW